jgi:hypothetical protein
LGEFPPTGWLFTLGSLCENFRSSTNNWATFFIGKKYALIITKMDWATVWATFSPTHPVTLVT